MGVEGVADGSTGFCFPSFRDLIFAAVGVHKGSRFRGGSLSEAVCLLLGFGGDFCLGSDSFCRLLEMRDDALGARGVSRIFMASAKVVISGLAEMGVSTGGRLEDLAEKNGCSSSLPGDSYAFGIAGTGGTAISVLLLLPMSRRGFGVGSRDELGFCEIRAFKEAELRAEL